MLALSVTTSQEIFDKNNETKASNNSESLTKHLRLIRALTNKDRRAASIPDRTGRLPLHLALTRKLLWNEGLKDVFTAFPGAVSIQNTTTRSFPFMDAAAIEVLSTSV